jgi:pimeloyl-ACP methyl ester carboxylesterase
MKARQSRSRRAARRRRRGAAHAFWPVLGLVAVGVALAVLASRRRHARDAERWETGAGSSGGRAGAAAGAGAGSAARESPADLGAGDAGEAKVGVASAEALETGETGGTAATGERGPADTGGPRPPAQSWIAGPAGNLFLRDSGESERLPVLFVHSLAGNGGQWALQLDHLGRHRRALALDLRGHGDSDPADDGTYDVTSLAADVAAVADQCSLRRFVLAGHSLGAAVAIAYAARHPERVAGLLLVDPNGDQTRIPRGQIEPFLAALRADPLGEIESYFRQLVAGGDREAARWVLEDLRLTHEEAIPAAVAGAVEFAPLPALARYGGPTLAVISEMNSLPYSLHQLLPDLPVHLMRGTGHWLMMDRPELFNQVLDGFLDRIESA